jgi:outer membrane protein assembly factor BamA
LPFGLSALAALAIAGGCAAADVRTDPPTGPATAAPAQQRSPEPAPADAAANSEEKKERTWMVAPLFSSTPKLGTSYGVMAGALHHFDPQSRVSMVGFSAQRTTTDSMKASVSAKGSFGADRHRVQLSANVASIKNEYDDYLGTGIALRNVEDARGIGGNYLYRVSGNVFAGAQAVFKNYQVVGQSPSDAENLAMLGIAGLRSGGVGGIVQNDTRDNDNSPTRGWLVKADNFAFRQDLGGDYDYDLYRFDLRGFWAHGRGHVFAFHQANQWTFDAPIEAKSSINIRGYKSGQFLGDHVSTVEVEERLHLAKRWGATAFLGLGCLYGGGEVCGDRDNLYPSYGGGIQFVLVPTEGIVGSLEYGRGKDDSSGVYLRLGYDF